MVLRKQPWSLLRCACLASVLALSSAQELPPPRPDQRGALVRWPQPPAADLDLDLPVIATFPKAVREASHHHSEEGRHEHESELEGAEATAEEEDGEAGEVDAERVSEEGHEGGEGEREAHGEVGHEGGEVHEEGHEGGHEEGHEEGHLEGHEEGHEEGHKSHEFGEEGHEGHEFGHELGEEAEVEAERNEAVDLAVAATLLGGVAFVMGTFYLVNHSDRDIQLNAWEAVSSTISIFVAVLFFGGVVGITEMLESKLMHEGEHGLQMGPLVQLVGWFCILHFAIGKLSHAACGHHPDAVDDEDEEMTIKTERTLEAWSTLFAHVSAFATIHAGLSVKHAQLLPPGLFSDILLVLLFFVVLFIFFRASDYIRAYICTKEHEDTVLKLWDAVAEEAENDVGSLALSFLILEGLVSAVTGHSHVLHDEHEEEGHLPIAHTLALLFFAVVFFGLRVAMMYIILWVRVGDASPDMEFESTAGLDSFWDYSTRWLFIIQNVLSMCFAWCFYFVITWETRRCLMPAHFISAESDAEKAVVALIASMMAFGAIMVLDYFSDKYSGADTEMLLRGMIRSLGVLVGFSWEHAFEGGVEVISELTAEKGEWYPLIVRLGMALGIGLGITPAWERYILRNVLNLRKALEKGEGEKIGRATVAANAARSGHQQLMLQGVMDIEAYQGEDAMDREGFMVSIKSNVPKEMSLDVHGVFPNLQAGSHCGSGSARSMRSVKSTPRSVRFTPSGTPRDSSLPHDSSLSLVQEDRTNADSEEETALLSEGDVHSDRMRLEMKMRAEFEPNGKA